MEVERRVFSVSEVTRNIKIVLGSQFDSIWVEGEISNFRPSSAGHWYFSLKDEAALLGGVMFSRSARDVPFKLEDGLKVVCFGSIDVYAPRGQYQLIIERIEPKGVGSLQLALEQLKIKLEKEGLFSPERKKPIPYLPARIGVVTSPTGAAIKDMLKVLDRRFKDVHIIVAGVKVQGEGAKEEISSAIADFNAYNGLCARADKIDVLIVGRGGGSMEDLWAFNEEIVARAIAASDIPVISAVGHERDVTVADLVADLRAATPSVAAEIVIPRKEDLREEIIDKFSRLNNTLSALVAESFQREEDVLRRLRLVMDHIQELNSRLLESVTAKLLRTNPALVIPEHLARINDLARQICVRAGHFVELKRSQFGGLAEKLVSLNPLNILARGYSVTFLQPGGAIIKDSCRIKPGDIISTKLYKGGLKSRVLEVEQNGGN